MSAPSLSRRDFVRSAGILIAFSLAPRLGAAQSAAKRLPGSLESNRMLDAWLRIEPEGWVTVFTGKVELGQGIVTALAQIAAEELDLPLAQVRMISGDTATTPNEGVTSGSQSIEQGGMALRFAAAEARHLLLERAAKRFAVPADGLVVAGATILAPDARQVTYWELARETSLRREATAAFAPKAASEHRIVGRPVARRDIPAKVTGGASYVQDMRLPGMLFGRVVRPPSYHAKLTAFEEAKVRALPGVVAVVSDGSFLGVVAEREEQALRAREALAGTAEWQGSTPLPSAAGIHDYLKGREAQSMVISERSLGSSPAERQTVQARYTRPYQAHASIGPSAAVAEFRDGELTVWSHSQGVFPLRRDLAKCLRMAEGKIRVVHAQGSGCYGHNGADDVALDAALLARAAPGRPVKLQWMREDEFAWEPYGPAMVMELGASLGAEGEIVDWRHAVWSNTHSTRPGGGGAGVNLLAAWQIAEPFAPPPAAIIPQPSGGGDRNAIPLYDFPQQRVVHHFVPEMPLRVSALRTLGAYANVFAIESFMDELALAAGADPVEFRLRHLKDERARAVLMSAAARSGWRPDQRRDGARGRGVGFARYKNSATFVAVVAEVTVDRASGEIRVVKATVAADAGQIINPNGLANQLEGGIVQSTSWTLKEAVRFDRERITSLDWWTYPILTFAEVPEIDVVLLDRPNEAPLGAGEAAQGPTAAAIANAFAHATGRRLRDLPFDPERVKAALA